MGGLNHDIDSEGSDRTDMKLPYGQDMLIEELLKVRKDLIIILIGASREDIRLRGIAKLA